MVSEDVGSGDLTSLFTPNKKIQCTIKCKQTGYISGIPELQILFDMYSIKCWPQFADGDKVKIGDIAFKLTGPAHDLMMVERIALNILSRMSGITTHTVKYVKILKKVGSNAQVTATRKTTPLLRYFEKRAVVVGGGLTHRMGLYDMVMIKDNHLKLFAGDIKKALSAAHGSIKKHAIEVEAATTADAVNAAVGGADVVMLDNMSPEKVEKTLKALEAKGVRDDIVVEVSGGITIDNLSDYAVFDVDWISVGQLTHSPEALDFSMYVVEA
ncbi:carboxylating nicotinate-nucleotide diphosphorylase [Candidatus Altiarchaeota archaeon]